MARASKHYINNKKFFEEMVKRKEMVLAADAEGIERPRISEYIGECILKLAQKVSNRPEFRGYTYKDEMEADAMMICVKYLDSFDPEKSKYPFGYFTRVVMNAFWHRLKMENRERYVKIAATNHMDLNGLLVEMQLGDRSNPAHDAIVDYFNDDARSEFVARFEEKNLKPKEKKKAIVEPSANTIDSYIED